MSTSRAMPELGKRHAAPPHGLRRLEITPPSGVPLTLHLLPFDLSTFDPASFRAAGLVLPPSLTHAVPKRQAEFLNGRLAAMAALQGLGRAAVQLPIGDSREAVWPVGTVGCITHVQQLAAAAAARSDQLQALGIDLERTVDDSAQSALVQVAFDANEVALLAALPGALSLAQRLTIAFSAKESLYKAAFRHVQRFFGFEAARVVALDADRQRLTLQLTEALHPRYPLGRCCELGYQQLEADLFLTVFADPV